MIHPVPDGEKHIVMIFHFKNLVEFSQNLAGISKIHMVQGFGPQCIDNGYGQKGCPDPVSAYIQQVHGKMIRVDPVVTE